MRNLNKKGDVDWEEIIKIMSWVVFAVLVLGALGFLMARFLF